MTETLPTDEEFIALATSSASLDRSPKSNWVESAGGLPPYIRKIARAIHQKRGLPLDKAIEIAIGKIKDWAAGGDDVTAKTRAKAAAALARWEALKAKSGKRVALSADALLVFSDLNPGQEHLLRIAYEREYGEGDIVEYRADSILVDKTDALTGERTLESVEFAWYGDDDGDVLFSQPEPLERVSEEDVDLTETEVEEIIAYYEATQ